MLLGVITLWGKKPAPPLPPAVPAIVAFSPAGPSGFMVGGKPVTYIPKKSKAEFPDREIEENELEELLAMLGIEL